jgi:hypothetical protein
MDGRVDGPVGLVTVEDFELMGIKKEEFGKGKVENGRKGSSTCPG